MHCVILAKTSDEKRLSAMRSFSETLRGGEGETEISDNDSDDIAEQTVPLWWSRHPPAQS